MKTRVLSAVGVVALGVLASCSGTPEAPSESSGSSVEYLPGLSATVDLVEDAPAVIVIVPGGAWAQVWDPPGFRPLAEEFVAAGFSVVQIAYRTAETQSYYPLPLQDVVCAGAYAAEQVPDVPVVLVGHSAGGHLVALAGLRPDAGDCPYAEHPADAVVGLAGCYDVERLGDLAENLFGAPASEAWQEGNPMAWVGERPEVPFLLAHGTADSLPVSFTRNMAGALEGAGHPVTVEVLDGREHNDLYQADVVGGLIVDWINQVVLG